MVLAKIIFATIIVIAKGHKCGSEPAGPKKYVKGPAMGHGFYSADQMNKLCRKFDAHRWDHDGMEFNLGYRFVDWNDWRESDGMLCRGDSDCNWINPLFFCHGYEVPLDTSSIHVNC